MKKFFLLFLALGAVAFAGEADGESLLVKQMVNL
jgi:hypothetical protein